MTDNEIEDLINEFRNSKEVEQQFVSYAEDITAEMIRAKAAIIITRIIRRGQLEYAIKKDLTDDY